MNNPLKSGLYLVIMNRLFDILRFQIYDEHTETETSEWQYPGNPINIATKYDHHPSKWIEMPEVTDRWSKDEPLNDQICVVHLVGKKLEDHGFVIAKYKDQLFIFEPAYGGWQKDYDDWQIDAWGSVPNDFKE